jgi:hypothetical protein
MSIFARSHMSFAAHSFETGVDLARKIRDGFAGQRLEAVIAYATVNHDQNVFLSGIREIAGANVPVIGCSGQGVMGRGDVTEEGYVAGAMGLGGASLDVACGCVEELQIDTRDKGHALGRTLRDRATGPLRAVVVHYDPLCGADVEAFLQGLHDEVQCPIVGGAAAQFWGPMLKTFQYFDGRAIHRAAVAAGLSGEFFVETDICHGTSPIGIEMTVTKADGTSVLEFDGRPALQVWQEFCSEAPEHIDHSGAIGVGLPTRRRRGRGVSSVTASVGRRRGSTSARARRFACRSGDRPLPHRESFSPGPCADLSRTPRTPFWPSRVRAQGPQPHP